MWWISGTCNLVMFFYLREWCIAHTPFKILEFCLNISKFNNLRYCVSPSTYFYLENILFIFWSLWNIRIYNIVFFLLWCYDTSISLDQLQLIARCNQTVPHLQRNETHCWVHLLSTGCSLFRESVSIPKSVRTLFVLPFLCIFMKLGLFMTNLCIYFTEPGISSQSSASEI